MDFAKLSDAGLLKLHGAVREALEVDDQLHLAGLSKVYGVREFSDWRDWSNAIEAELDRRSVKYQRVAW